MPSSALSASKIYDSVLSILLIFSQKKTKIGEYVRFICKTDFSKPCLCLAHAQCATIRMNTVIQKVVISNYKCNLAIIHVFNKVPEIAWWAKCENKVWNHGEHSKLWTQTLIEMVVIVRCFINSVSETMVTLDRLSLYTS